MHHEIGQRDQDARLQRQLQAHGLEQGHHLRHQVGEQEDHHRQHHHQDERGVHQQLAGLRHQLVLPLERLAQVLEHLHQAPGLLAGADQADEHRGEHLREGGQALRQHLAALDVLEHRGENFAEARVFHAAAQIAQALDERNAGARDLLQVEAEGDQVAAGDAALGEAGAAGAHGPEGDEVEPHALEAQLEVDLVGRVELAARGASDPVDGFVLKCWHGRVTSRSGGRGWRAKSAGSAGSGPPSAPPRRCWCCRRGCGRCPPRPAA